MGAGHRGADPRGPSSWLTPDRSQSCLPGHNTERALEHYAIGFAVEPYPDGGYGFAQRDGVGIHLNLVPDLAVDANQTAVYLYVSDADALAEQWRLTRPSKQAGGVVDLQIGAAHPGEAPITGLEGTGRRPLGATDRTTCAIGVTGQRDRAVVQSRTGAGPQRDAAIRCAKPTLWS